MDGYKLHLHCWDAHLILHWSTKKCILFGCSIIVPPHKSTGARDTRHGLTMDIITTELIQNTAVSSHMLLSTRTEHGHQSSPVYILSPHSPAAVNIIGNITLDMETRVNLCWHASQCHHFYMTQFITFLKCVLQLADTTENICIHITIHLVWYNKMQLSKIGDLTETHIRATMENHHPANTLEFHLTNEINYSN